MMEQPRVALELAPANLARRALEPVVNASAQCAAAELIGEVASLARVTAAKEARLAAPQLEELRRHQRERLQPARSVREVAVIDVLGKHRVTAGLVRRSGGAEVHFAPKALLVV